MAFYSGICIASHILEADGPTVLEIGGVALGEFLSRVAGDIVEGAAAVTPATIDLGPPNTEGSWRIVHGADYIALERCDVTGTPGTYNEYWRQTK